MKDLIFICHSSYYKDVPFDPNFGITFGFLNHYFGESGYSTIRHSLYKGGESRIYREGCTDNYYKVLFLGSLPNVIRYISELVVNFFILLFNRPKIVIAIDPLSCFIPSLLWKIGYIKKVFFITPDFAEERFENKILNKIYFFIDKFCTFNSSRNIVCAQTVIDYKISMYKAPGKLFFHMPNIPNPWVIDNLKNIKKVVNRIVYVGNISKQVDFYNIFKIFSAIKNKEKNISLHIIGDGDLKNSLVSYVRENDLEDIHFCGQLNYQDTLKEIAESEIGIALYNGSLSYDKFRDSCKIREYQSLLTIPITTLVVKANVDEIKEFNSGVIVNSNDMLSEILSKLLLATDYKRSFLYGMGTNNNLYLNKYKEMFSLVNL